jgi:O-antigen ligase
LSLVANISRFPLPELLTGSLYLVRWVLYAALYVLVLQNYADSKLWLKGLYAVGVGFGILGLAQFFLYPDLRNLMYLGWDPHYYRLFSTLLDPNFMGIILVFTILLGFGLRVNHRILIIAGQLVAFVALLLTYSRSSFLAFIAAFIVLAYKQKNRMFVGSIVLFLAIVWLLPKFPALSLLRWDSTNARIGNWQESAAMISKAPVFGYGFDTLRYVRAADISSKAAAGLDSSLLFVLATTGIVGFFAYMYLLISMIRIGRISSFYIASLAALIVHSLFVNSMFYPWVMVWVWILAGVVTYDT